MKEIKTPLNFSISLDDSGKKEVMQRSMQENIQKEMSATPIEVSGI